jgi:hypothetical protein
MDRAAMDVSAGVVAAACAAKPAADMLEPPPTAIRWRFIRQPPHRPTNTAASPPRLRYPLEAFTRCAGVPAIADVGARFRH